MTNETLYKIIFRLTALGARVGQALAIICIGLLVHLTLIQKRPNPLPEKAYSLWMGIPFGTMMFFFFIIWVCELVIKIRRKKAMRLA